MPDYKLSRCRSCGAPIIWIKTENNRNMPCNPERVMYRAVRGGRERIVTDSGKIEVSELVTDPTQADGEGYIPHWATCPNFRK